MNIKKIVNNDDYLSEKKDKVVKVAKYLKHQWLFLLGVFGITFVASLTTFISASYFNSNSQRIEAAALTGNTDDINEITLRSRINDGRFPNDIFASPDDQIVYLQENYPDIKTFKVYNAYEPYRGTDTINGFYYVGNPNDKPASTYANRFNDNVRRYTNFLSIDDGSYLDIELEYSANRVEVEDRNEEGNIIGRHIEYRFMRAYLGNEIYLPYDFAANTLLPQYQNGYFGNNEDMELEDLINREFVLFSVMANRFTVDTPASDQTEYPNTYIIKGIMREDTEDDFKDYFIIPFRKEMLTQPRVFFKASSDADANNAYMSKVKSFTSDESILRWGISTRFTEPLLNYVRSNTPAKRVGIFLSLTMLILISEGYVFFLYLKNVHKKDKDSRIRVTAITSSIVIFLATLFAGAIAKAINGSSFCAWPTSAGNLKTPFFTTASAMINSILGLILIVGGIIATTKLLKYFKNKELINVDTIEPTEVKPVTEEINAIEENGKQKD